MKNYTSKTEIENYLMQEIDDTFDSQLDSWMESIEAFIDGQTGRNFKADSTAAARLFNGENEREIFIDDCVEITKVEITSEYVATEEVLSADYVTEPANEERKDRICLLYGVFPAGIQNISITAKWGYSEVVPTDIRLAATILVAGIINFASPNSSKIKSRSIGGYSVTYKDEKGWQDMEMAKAILDRYKKFTF